MAVDCYPVIEKGWPERKRRKCKERLRSRNGTPAAPTRTEVSDRRRKRLNLNGRQQRFPARERVSPQARDQDRKSTRLNSSHGYISYAVFCLKKKKKNK